jgi:hypothetical protein
LLALKQRLEEENNAIHQQLKDTNTKEKRHLQLIQDLEQELRYNTKHHSEADRASIVRSDTSMAAFTNGVATNRISDQVRSQSDHTACSPAVHVPDVLDDISIGSSGGLVCH